MSTPRITRRETLLLSSAAAALGAARLASHWLPSASSASAAELASAVRGLHAVPAEIGAWTSTAGTISEREQNVASIHGYVRRDYQHQDSGHQVGMTLLCGPAGPMAVHPPTACFEGVGFTLLSGPVISTFGRQPIATAAAGTDPVDGHDEFNRSTFRQGSGTASRIVRAFWAWSSDGHWMAPSQPRIAFRGHSWLYKLYITDQTLHRPGSAVSPQSESFLTDALPVLREALRSDRSTAAPV